MTVEMARRVIANLEQVARTCDGLRESHDPVVVSRAQLIQHNLADAAETVRRWAREDAVRL